MTKVKFHYADVPAVNLKNKTRVKIFVEELFKKENKTLHAISYIFCSDEYLLRINKEFLQHDDYTDIITFDLTVPGNGITGEIYLSTERIKENAKDLNTKYGHEMLRVLFHGALHLCGYGDKKKGEITIMRQLEDKYLRLFEETA